jgi:PAS domain S-box-containing protein
MATTQQTGAAKPPTAEPNELTMKMRAPSLFTAGLILSGGAILLHGLGLSLLPDASQRVTLNMGMNLAAIGLGTLSALYTTRQVRSQPRLARAWWMLVFNLLAAIIGNFLAVAQSLLTGQVPFPSVADLFFLCTYPLTLLTAILMPADTTPRLQRIEAGFDAVIVALSSGLLWWYFIARMNLLTSGAAPLQLLVSAAYTVGDLVLLWAALMLLLRRFSGQQRRPLWWLMGAILCQVVYDIWTNLSAPTAGALPHASTPWEILGTATGLLIMLAGLRQVAVFHAPARPPRTPSPQATHLRLILPYLWLLVSYAVVPLSLLVGPALPPILLTFWVGLGVVLVMVRQILVIQENQQLSTQLRQSNLGLETANTELQAEITAHRHAERRLADIINFLPDATWVINLAGEVIAWNRTMEALTGVAASTIVGQGQYAHAVPLYGERRPVLIDLVLRPEAEIEKSYPGLQRAEGRLIGETATTVNGQRHYLWGTAAVLYDAYGHAVGAIESIRDMTAYQEAKAALQQAGERLRLAAHAGRLGLWEWNYKTGESYLNDEWFELIGETRATYAAKTPAGMNPNLFWESQLHPDDRERAVTHLKDFQTGRAPIYEMEFRHAHTSRQWVWLYAFGTALERDAAGGVIAAVGFDQDITERKQTEAELRRRAEELETLNRVGLAIASGLDLEQVLEGLYRQCQQVVSVDTFYVALYDETANLIRFPIFFNRGERVARPTYPLESSSGLTAYIITTRQTLYLPDSQQLQPSADLKPIQLPDSIPTRGYLGVPLIVSDHIVGVFSVQSDQPNPYTPAQIALMETIALQAALAIEHARLFTEARLAREQAEQLNRIIPSAIFTVDRENHVTSWNKRAQEITGYTAAEVVGRACTVFAQGRCQDFCGLFSPEANLPIVRGARQIRTKAGRLIHILKNADVIRNAEGEVIGGIESFEDITEQREQAEALQTALQEAQRLRTTAQQAQEAAEAAAAEAAAATRTKSVFLANMSHEIRTPLNAIIGMTSLLLDTPLNSEQSQFASTVRAGGEALLALVSDILDFSKIEAGRLELECQPFDVQDCVEQTLDLVALRAAEKGLELVYDFSPEVPTYLMGDVLRLRQILVNLVNNAVKFTGQGEIVITVDVATPPAQAPDSAVQLRFAVRDTGVGIPLEQHSRLFQSFAQVDASTTRKYGGTGLGLAISKRLVELMAGDIWVESSGQPGEGSTFFFTVTLRMAADRRQAGLEKPPNLLAGKRILIEEANRTSRTRLDRWARAWQMEPTLAGSVPEALAALETGRTFDVVLTSSRWPDGDGLALARALRQRASTQTVPLVVAKSLGQAPSASEPGLITVSLTKPYKLLALQEGLEQALTGLAELTPRRRAAEVQWDAYLAVKYPLRILLAEDNPVNQQVALLFLAKLGYHADLASNGLEVVEALERQAYDVVLLDVQMPEMDGLETARCLRQQRLRDFQLHLKIQPYLIALTANATETDRQECLQAGMNDYLSKPLSLRALAEALIRQRAAAPEPHLEPPSESLPLFDAVVLQQLQAQLDPGGAAMVADLVDKFVDQGSQVVTALQVALAAGEASQLRLLAHTAKGNGATFGLLRFSHWCRELERLTRLDDRGQTADALAQAEAAYRQGLPELLAYRRVLTPRAS